MGICVKDKAAQLFERSEFGQLCPCIQQIFMALDFFIPQPPMTLPQKSPLKKPAKKVRKTGNT